MTANHSKHWNPCHAHRPSNSSTGQPWVERGHVAVRRRWRAGDELILDLSILAERIRAHPDVRADQGRVALKRGPIVYCVEEADNTAAPHRLVLPRGEPIKATFEPDLLGGVATLNGTALAVQRIDGALYRSDPWPQQPAAFKAVPYHVWDHRTPGEMLVWLPEA
jgi:DUF1680 family protein